MRESLTGKKRRARLAEDGKSRRAANILAALRKAYPDAGIILKYKNPMQLLASVILSAQATDMQVNNVTAQLFRKYKTVDDFAGADLRVFTCEVSGVNFYKNKARFIVESARMIRDQFGGRMPDDISELVHLPGVARKTANIIMWHVYHKAQGIVVDTHVKRVSYNLGLTKHTDPVRIEQDLMKLYPASGWGMIGHYFQAYGRTAMPARGKPKMDDPLKNLY